MAVVVHDTRAWSAYAGRRRVAAAGGPATRVRRESHRCWRSRAKISPNPVPVIDRCFGGESRLPYSHAPGYSDGSRRVSPCFARKSATVRADAWRLA
jgi:hypothetical protein